MELNETERKVFCQLLDDLSDSMGNAGCNDFDLPKTAEGQALANEVDSFDKDPEDARNPAPLCCMDFVVLAVLRKKLGLETKE